MARKVALPLVYYARLVQPGNAAEAIPVGSPAWYAWLANASSFAFQSSHGRFTAYKERRGPSREYWKAYRRRAGRLRRVYLGKSGELTLERLNLIAAELAGDLPVEAPHAMANTAEGVLNRDAGGVQDGGFRSVDERLLRATSASDSIDNAQSLHLLSTKLVIPSSRLSLVPRPRLMAQIDAALARGQKLILFAAPAGFGKTTAVAEWLRGADDRHVAWLALDDADNHISQFLAYLIAALETVHPQIGAEAWALLRARVSHPPTHAILTTLLNVLADSAERIMLILDDYHTISLQAIHEAIAFLLDRMPLHMHIIITTRVDPPLPLARLRARGQLTEVRAADLRFTRDEAIYLFDHIHHIPLDSDAMATLESRTEGWGTGLQLAALSLQQRDAADIPAFLDDFTGSHTYVFDYLADEVFQKQPDHVRRFLVRTAILERLCEPLCAAVTGQDDAQTLLEHLDQANLFLIRLDTNRRWYRYHPLFRDFLREHLDRAVEAADRAQLCRRASAWFEQQGLFGEAIDYALQAEAWSDALRCFAPMLASERFYDYFLDWPRWVAALPDDALRTAPEICLRLAWILVLTGHGDAAERPLDLIEAVWLAAGNQPKLGEVLGMRAFALGLLGHFPRAILLAQQALTRLPADAIEQRGIAIYILGFNSLSLGHMADAAGLLTTAHAALQGSSETLLSLGTSFGLARVYQLQGQLHHAAALYQETSRRAGDATYLQVPAAHIYLGMLFYEWNDLAAAERVLRVGITVGQRTGRGRYWPTAYSALARMCWVRGEAAEAITLVERALEVARLLDNPREIAEAEAQRAWLWLAQGDLAAALRWVTARALKIEDAVPYERQAEYLMLARIRIAQELQAPGSVDLDAVVGLLARLRQAAEVDTRAPDQIAILALTALAHAARHDPNQALESLAVALLLAAPEEYIRTFVDEGAPMRSLLLALRARISADESGERPLAYLERLLDAFPADISGSPSPSPTLLSEREHAVLQCIAEGRSVQEIAIDLVISAHTARTHVKNIYRKLDAHNRVQALERARALHLL